MCLIYTNIYDRSDISSPLVGTYSAYSYNPQCETDNEASTLGEWKDSFIVDPNRTVRSDLMIQLTEHTCVCSRMSFVHTR